MRGRITDQDLTNYALNDGLEPSERLYVESHLALSEECREDVYNMLEMMQLLEDGFERESGRLPAMLTDGQRLTVLQIPPPNLAAAFLRRTAAILAVAACAAFACVNLQLLSGGEHARKKMAQVSSTVAHVSNQMSKMVSSGASVQDADFASFVDLHVVDDSSSWLQTASESLPQAPATICTPPSWPDATSFVRGR